MLSGVLPDRNFPPSSPARRLSIKQVHIKRDFNSWQALSEFQSRQDSSHFAALPPRGMLVGAGCELVDNGRQKVSDDRLSGDEKKRCIDTSFEVHYKSEILLILLFIYFRVAVIICRIDIPGWSGFCVIQPLLRLDPVFVRSYLLVMTTGFWQLIPGQ